MLTINTTSTVTSFDDFKNATNFQINEYFSNKNLEELSVYELAYIYLDTFFGKTSVKNVTVSTCLYDLVENTRASYSNVRTRIYTPLLGSFIILDQLGSIFCDPSNPSTNGINIILKLYGYDENTIQYLLALRNGLMHDGSLTSLKQNEKQRNTVFRLSPDLDTTVKLSSVDWDGIYHDDLTPYLSKINSKRFFEEVLIIIELSKKALIEQSFALKITDAREFYYKFLF